MAFRDETEALRARIEALESELGEAKATIAKMKGADESVSVESVPKRQVGWKRRVRRFHGDLSEKHYEHLARLIPELTAYPTRPAASGIDSFKVSTATEVVFIGREDNELVLVYDEGNMKLRRIIAPILFSILPVVYADRNGPDWVGPVTACTLLIIILSVYALVAFLEKKRFAKGDKLFEVVGAYIDRSVSETPAPTAEHDHDHDFEEAEHEDRKTAKSMEA